MKAGVKCPQWAHSSSHPAPPYLFDFSLQVSQLNALLQVPAVLLGRHVQFLLLLVEKLEQVLHPRGHIDIPVAQQLHTWRRDTH